MKLQRLIDSLERFQHVLPALVRGLDEETVRWSPPSGNWSIVEIVCHLADEEVEDFRTRVRMTLENPADAWPSIDPEGVALSRDYANAILDDVLERFLNERRKSVEWLRQLSQPDWQLANVHPRFGPIRAGEVMAAWVAHDQLHTRQIAKRLFEVCQLDAAPFGVNYAGDLTA